MKLKVKYLSDEATKLEMPREGDIGIDLYASKDAFVFNEGEAILVSTGVSVQLPEGYWLQIVDRSSVSKYCHVLAGIVDEGYRGELKVRMMCHTARDVEEHDEITDALFPPGYASMTVFTPRAYEIKAGDKIAQLIIRKNCNRGFEIEEVKDLSDTDRGAGGFGSTGK